MTAGQLGRRARHLARQLAIGHDRAGKGDRTDEDAQEQFHMQDRQLGRGFLGDQLGKSAQIRQIRLRRAVRDRHDLRHIADLKMRVEAHEHSRQTDQRVHRGHQLRHLGHLHALRHILTDQTTARDQQQRQQPQARTGANQRGKDRQRHTDDAIPDRALGAFLVRQTAKRKDEQNSRNNIGGSGEAKFHVPGLLKISGTWRACAGLRGSRRRC